MFYLTEKLAECNLYIRACIAYYELDNPIMLDNEFDILQEQLENNYDSLSGYHKWLFGPKESLKQNAYTIPKQISEKRKKFDLDMIKKKKISPQINV